HTTRCPIGCRPGTGCRTRHTPECLSRPATQDSQPCRYETSTCSSLTPCRFRLLWTTRLQQQLPQRYRHHPVSTLMVVHRIPVRRKPLQHLTVVHQLPVGISPRRHTPQRLEQHPFG